MALRFGRSQFRLALSVLAAAYVSAIVPASAQSWQAIVEAAEKEGTVTVISPPVPTHRATLERFKEAYPKINVQVAGLPASAFEPRIDAERTAGIYNWDVMVAGASPTSYTKYIPSKWMASVRDAINPENAKDSLWTAGFDAGFMDKEKKYFFAFQASRPRVIYINRSVIPESELNSFADLTKPEFKGKIAMFDPRVGGPGGSVAAQLVLALGKDRATAFFRDQELVLSTTPRQLAEWVVRGTYPIGLALVDRDMTDFASRGVGLDVKPLSLPTAMQAVNPQWGVVGMFNNAPHPNAAKVFINWLLSKDAQSDWANRSASNSRRVDAELGDPSNVVTAEQWVKGMNMSAESQLGVRMETLQITKSVLK